MARHIPPPIALRSFEAAARHLSFTRAADELSVTQAAISHQIKQLEAYFSFPLFVRLTRKLRLTDEGQALYSVVNESFENIEKVTQQLLGGTGDESLTVSLTPYFSVKWLTVRLSRFWALHPNIDLRLHHTAQPGSLEDENIDLSITWGLDDWPHLDWKPLLTARVIPVCSPSLVTPEKPLNTIDDLYRHTLLHENDYSLWTLWLQRAGIEDVQLRRGSTMDDANVVMQAAIDGHGVALGSDLLCADDLEARRLIMPFDSTNSMTYSYYIVYRPGALERPKVKAFYNWLRRETREMDGSGTEPLDTRDQAA